MPTLLESPPQVPRSFEELPLLDPEFTHVPVDAAVAERIGGAALDQEVDASYVEEGLKQIDAYLSVEGNDVASQPIVDERVHDIEAAHEAAIEENIAFDYAAALEENEEREHKSKVSKEEEPDDKSEPLKKELPDALQDDPIAAPALHPEATTLPTDYRTQAGKLLKEAGYSDKLPLEAQVRKDSSTGNLLVVSGNNIKVVKLHPGDGPKVVEYTYDEGEGMLTARAQGLTLAQARVKELLPNEVNEEQLKDMVNLPSIAA